MALISLREFLGTTGGGVPAAGGAMPSFRTSFAPSRGSLPSLRQFASRFGDFGTRQAFTERTFVPGRLVFPSARTVRPTDLGPLSTVRSSLGFGAFAADLPNLPATAARLFSTSPVGQAVGAAPVTSGVPFPALGSIARALGAAGLLADIPLTLTGPGSTGRKSLATARDIAGLGQLAAGVPAITKLLPFLSKAAPFLSKATPFLNVGLGALDLAEGRTGSGIGTLAGTGLGFLLGGPAGAAIGGGLGGVAGSLLGGLGGRHRSPAEKAAAEVAEAQRDIGKAQGFISEINAAGTPDEFYRTLVKWSSGSVGGVTTPAVVTQAGEAFIGFPNPTYPVLDAAGLMRADPSSITTRIQSGVQPGFKAGFDRAAEEAVRRKLAELRPQFDPAAPAPRRPLIITPGHQYEWYHPQGQYVPLSAGEAESRIKAGDWVYDRTAGTWYNHPTAGPTTLMYDPATKALVGAPPMIPTPLVLTSSGLDAPAA